MAAPLAVVAIGAALFRGAFGRKSKGSAGRRGPFSASGSGTMSPASTIGSATPASSVRGDSSAPPSVQGSPLKSQSRPRRPKARKDEPRRRRRDPWLAWLALAGASLAVSLALARQSALHPERLASATPYITSVLEHAQAAAYETAAVVARWAPSSLCSAASTTYDALRPLLSAAWAAGAAVVDRVDGWLAKGTPASFRQSPATLLSALLLLYWSTGRALGGLLGARRRRRGKRRGDTRAKGRRLEYRVVDQSPAPLPDFTGVWIKDNAASDNMDECFRVAQLNFIMRKAVVLLKGMEIRHTRDVFFVDVLSVFPWYKIKESFPFDGAVRLHARRDMRRGKTRGRVAVNGTTVAITMEWDDPLAGTMRDAFSIGPQGELRLDSTLVVGSKVARFRQVYRRKGDS
ncbi:unnamed protein product [Pedinophyceae sp. YPF-701]|nr:unnamed protein product [Pedinophyceae sp. YPF-701]